MNGNSVKSLVDAIVRQSTDPDLQDLTRRGNAIWRGFGPSANGLDFEAEGWESYATDQDGADFGVWVNVAERATLTYSGTEWTYVRCHSIAGFNREIESMNRFYGEGEVGTVVSAGGQATVYLQDRSRFLL